MKKLENKLREIEKGYDECLSKKDVDLCTKVNEKYMLEVIGDEKLAPYILKCEIGTTCGAISARIFTKQMKFMTELD